MKYILMYDISVNKKRYIVSKILKEFGCVRVQKSVFMIEGTENLVKNIKSQLKKYFRGESLVIIPLEQKMLEKSKGLNDRFHMKYNEDIII